MYKIRRVRMICCALLFLLLIPAAVHADLGSFARNVEKEEAERARDADEKETEDSSPGNRPENSFARFFWEITIHLWFHHHNLVHYHSYPYQDSSGLRPHFILHDQLEWTEDSAGSYARRIPHPATGSFRKFFWFELLGGGLIGDDRLADPVFGWHASLQGQLLPFIGPDFEYRRLYDGTNELHTIAGGFSFPVVQHDYFSMALYAQAAALRGVLDRDGGAAGIVWRSYPGRPISLYLRTGGMFFEHIEFLHLSGRVNLHRGPLLFYSGANLLQARYDRLLNFEAGIGLRL
ncbi:hypothetical protein [Spirochaeta africana]|uniref:Uncharacterized protein n=1 Tax=Spirochaeta africana (strain ATCC 700263 / DSM 8902 / Z-7692) TaxID=889378 RepID=H9UII4_SPIAZ|nr:hypothetical protein [Spirochaeta africana]AFG37327.1 hypothetical protein Spiaf_1252 [Spirochaeta africana DSM 8902]